MGGKRFIRLSDLMRGSSIKCLWYRREPPQSIQSTRTVPCAPGYPDQRSSRGEKSDNRVVYRRPLISPGSRIHSADALDAIFPRCGHARNNARTHLQNAIALQRVHRGCPHFDCMRIAAAKPFRKTRFNNTEMSMMQYGKYAGKITKENVFK